ncbi:hypothetical protein ABZ445_16250 [Streptomyces chartreusis]|uniref:hypothetical protein n=1 Tax=Streptomyces chartreusis TaxID=1969 RepID=UPI003406E0F3
MKRIVTFTGILEYDPADYSTDPEAVVDLALINGDKHAGYYLFHTGEMSVVDDHNGTPGM